MILRWSLSGWQKQEVGTSKLNCPSAVFSSSQPFLLPVLDFTSSVWSPEASGFNAKQVPGGEPGKVSFKFHQVQSSHELIKILELESQ